MLLNVEPVARKAMINKLLLILALLLLIDFSRAAEGLSPPVSYSSSLLQMMLGLAATIVMIFVVVWLIKRVGYTGYNATNKMKIKGTLALSPKEKLLLIEVEGETILIGVAPGFVGLLKTLESDLTKPMTAANSTLYAEQGPNPLDSSDSTPLNIDGVDTAMTKTNLSNNKLVNHISSSFAEKLKAAINKSDTVK
ncbi:MAG: flagellar protein FliO/FliZ [Pseudohongiellaceae bacterium]|jgi:flagellar protein FliO/FliZ